MSGLGTYVASFLFYFLILGMALHVIDRWIGVPFYRWWYNRSRAEPLPDTVEMGFMYGRTFHRRRNWAFVISAVQSVYMVFTKGINPFVEVIVLAFESVVLLVGFALGAYAYRLIQRQEAIAEATDRIGGALEQDPKGFVFGSISNAFAALRARFVSKPTVSEPVIMSTSTPSGASSTPAEDWRTRLDKLKKKGV